jgi:hypothetical protein
MTYQMEIVLMNNLKKMHKNMTNVLSTCDGTVFRPGNFGTA